MNFERLDFKLSVLREYCYLHGKILEGSLDSNIQEQYSRIKSIYNHIRSDFKRG